MINRTCNAELLFSHPGRLSEDEYAEEPRDTPQTLLSLLVGSPMRLTPTSADIRHQLNQRFRIYELEQQVLGLRAELMQLKSQIAERGLSEDENAGRPADRANDPCLRDLVRITQEMFPIATPEIEFDMEDEDAENAFVVFNVRCAGDAKEIVQKHREWHRRVAQLRPGNSGTIRLTVYPV